MSNGVFDIMLTEVLHQTQDLNELAPSGVPHPDFHQPPQPMNTFRELPPVQRRRLIERLALVFQQRQVVQRIVDKVGHGITSDGCFVRAYPAETAEAFCDGHVAAFDFFGGVPRSILYDNTRLAVARIVKGGERLRSHMFAELQSHYLFNDRFGRPGKGNDKGKVEGLVG